MADTIEQAVSDPSFADLRAMAAGETVAPKAEPKKKAVEEKVEPEPETATEADDKPADQKQDAEPEDDLPKGVQKRIAKEVARQAEIDRKIHEAVATTKAKEAELAKVSSATGTEPDKTEPVTTGKPVRPEFKDGETWDQFQKRISEYEDARDAWVLEQGRAQGKAERESEARQQAARAAWDEQIKIHGDTFAERVESLRKQAPADVQTAIGELEKWGDVAMHLESHPEDLAAVLAQFQVSKTRGVAALGRIEDKVSAPKQNPAVEDLPKPPSKIGGRTSVTAGKIDLEKVDFSKFKEEARRMLKTG